jgi:hypothetical protein
MNKINPPLHNNRIIDDMEIIRNIANDTHSSSLDRSLRVRADLPLIVGGYANYIRSLGNAEVINPIVGLSCGGDLAGLYHNEPAHTSYLDSVRKLNNEQCCPMCGSFSTGTLDHVLPSSIYNEYFIFSKNLVPACQCNIKRQDVFKGGQPGERVLHPYFDAVLSQRLLKVVFTAPFDNPRIDISVAIPSTDPSYIAVNFHLNNVVLKSDIVQAMQRNWGVLTSRPQCMFDCFPKKVKKINPVEIRKLINIKLSKNDERYQSKNNWDSLFMAALLEDPIIEYICQRARALLIDNRSVIV